MKLSSLTTTNFRNLGSFKWLEIDPGISIISAPNGVGKSNVLEACYLLGSGLSPRTSKSVELISWEEDVARVQGSVESNSLVIGITKKGKEFYVNDRSVSMREFMPYFQVVFFHPPDLNLLTGSPQGRRRFLDSMLSQIDFEYLYFLVSFQKILKRRNTMLRDGVFDPVVMDIIEEQLAASGAELMHRRFQVIVELNEFLEVDGATIEYVPSPQSMRELLGNNAGNTPMVEQMCEFLREKYKKMREKEKNIGFSLMGPQRDDFKVFTNDALHVAGKKDVGVYGSRGQQRMAILRLKIAEGEIIALHTDSRPLLLLDDVFSELDEANRDILIEVATKQQTFITSAEQVNTADFPAHVAINLRELLGK